jgi:murein DD-endopeptidase MepM/ murein hydrolase activator NlpD
MINKIKQLQNKLKPGHIYSAVFSFFIGLALVLFTLEYQKFKKLASELFDLKEEYRVYTVALKKTIDEKNVIDQSVMNQKKKSEGLAESDDTTEEKLFLAINRDDDYLLNNALSFAKEHNLEDAVARLLDLEEWERRVKPPFKKKQQAKRFVASHSIKRFQKLASIGPKDFTFLWPVDRSKFWLSSLFGPRKIKNKGIKYHYGIDMAALKGTPVKAAAAGIVLESYWNNGYGNCIIIAHNRKYKTRYAHLDKRKVKVGQKVKRGQTIGTVGDTGLVRKSGKDASHLHFEVYAFGRHINPLSVLIEE